MGGTPFLDKASKPFKKAKESGQHQAGKWRMMGRSVTNLLIGMLEVQLTNCLTSLLVGWSVSQSFGLLLALCVRVCQLQTCYLAETLPTRSSRGDPVAEWENQFPYHSWVPARISTGGMALGKGRSTCWDNGEVPSPPELLHSLVCPGWIGIS